MAKSNYQVYYVLANQFPITPVVGGSSLTVHADFVSTYTAFTPIINACIAAAFLLTLLV